MRLWCSAIAAVVLVTGTVLASDAAACSVCFSGAEETRSAFIWTTVGLSLFPLAMIGGIVAVLVRRFRQLEREHAERVAAPAREAIG